jgi:predicted phage terminase large subunit-like protein
MELPKLNEKQKLELLLQLEAELYRKSLYEFFKAATKVLYPQVVWDYNFHFQYLCDEVLQPEIERINRNEKKTTDVLVALPFRSGKSILISQIFPVWIWISNPALTVMQVSHSELLAVKMSHSSKMLLESTWFLERFPELTIRSDTSAKNNYMNAHPNGGGKRISFGIGSSIIGEGCNVQILDDLNAPNDSIANSYAINTTYSETLYSRLNQPEIDIRIILQQRCSNVDIIAHLLKQDTTQSKYRYYCMPAKLMPHISPPELAQYYQEGLFWKNRFNNEILNDFQLSLGSRAYHSQLLQLPQSIEGEVVKRKWYQLISQEDFQLLIKGKQPEYHLFLDSAYTKSTANDSSAILLACAINNKLYIVKTWNVYLEFPELIKKLKTIYQLYDIRMLHIESKASGLSIKQELVRQGYNCKDLKAIGDKLSRVNAITPTLESLRVYILEDLEWNEFFLQQMAAFSAVSTSADDLVDVQTYAIDTLLNKNTFSYEMA